jgi:hypothetical protein
MSGDVMTGFTATLLFDDTTIDEARMHSYMSYNGTAYTCEVGDYDNWATDSLYFAGISMIRYPYKTYAELLAAPYTAINITVGYDAQEGAKQITVINNTVAIALVAESIVAGQQIMMSDEGNHSATDTHDGMVGLADGATAAEIAATIGVAMTNSTVPGTHTGHTYDMEDYDETNHPHIEMLLWR